ncbi:MAG: hypothetical protein LBU04_00855, partial [Christensenellaceae bacterium]|nr:hypothetical protein [Christensenellaceae bacterium]
QYKHDHIVLVCDNAWWHKSKYTKIPKDVSIVYIRLHARNEPNRTSMERNSNQISEPFCPNIETLLTELRKVIDGIPPDVFASITQRDWITESLDLKDK